MVFYRKYRSQTISELDLSSVRTKLTQLLTGDTIPHALLFTGPKGLGKTSSARILAKAVNCKDRVKIEPCNVCEICVSITKGSSIDVIEIDGASNRGIDEIRSLREKVKFAPSHLSKKIYIIDEVHMLTTEAFNALLKTLEEPPDHVMFVLCTTESWKLPVTITSRTFTVHFEKPTRDEIVRSLQRVVKGEELKVDEDVYDGIIELSDGAFRDAHKTLEELSLSVTDKHITKETLESVFKSTTLHVHIQNLFTALVSKNHTQALNEIGYLAENGADFKQVTSQLVDSVRLKLLDIVHTKKDQDSVHEYQALIELLNDAYKTISTSVLPQLPLEIASIKWCVGQSPAQPTKAIVHDDKPSEISSLPEEREQEPQPVAEKTVSNMLYPLIDYIKKENQRVAGLLRSCKVDERDSNTLYITAPFQFHKDKLQESGNIQIITQAASHIFEKPMKVEVVIAS